MTLRELRYRIDDAIEEGFGGYEMKDSFTVFDYFKDNTFDELSRIGHKYMLDFNIQTSVCLTTKEIRYALSFARLGHIGWLSNDGTLESVAGYGDTLEQAAGDYYDKIFDKTLVFNPDGKGRYEVTITEEATQ